MRYLFCDDHSDHSRAALHYLPSLATSADTIVVFSVLKSDIESNAEHDHSAAAHQLRAQITIAQESLDFVRDYILRSTPVPEAQVTTQLKFGPDCRHALSDYLRSVHPFDIIIVGSRGQGLVKRTLLGSFSDYVIHHAGVAAVLLVHDEPPSHVSSAGEELTPHAVVAVDGTPAAGTASALAGAVLNRYSVDLVTVQDFPRPYEVVWTRAGPLRVDNAGFEKKAQDNKHRYTEMLRESRAHLLKNRQSKLLVKTRVIDSPDVRDALRDYVSGGHVDILVTGTRQVGAAHRTFVGSVSNYLIHEVRVRCSCV